MFLCQARLKMKQRVTSIVYVSMSSSLKNETDDHEHSSFLVSVGHYNCLINSNNQVKHKLSTQGSLLFQR
jgi:hypothetical protein